MEALTNYDNFDHIGTGAFGTVYKARDKKNEGRFVALKKVTLNYEMCNTFPLPYTP